MAAVHLLALISAVALVSAAPAFLQIDGAEKELVVKGDTVAKISARTGIPADQIEKLNDIEDPDDLATWVDDYVWLVKPPKSADNINSQGANVMNDRRPSPSEVTVLESAVKARKKDDMPVMQPGGEMELSANVKAMAGEIERPTKAKAMAAEAPAAAAPANTPAMHTVQPGDTLLDICKKHRVQVADVKALNHIQDETALQVGMPLQLPAAGLLVMRVSKEEQKAHESANLAMAGLGSKDAGMGGGEAVPGMGSADFTDGMPVPQRGGHHHHGDMDNDEGGTDDD